MNLTVLVLGADGKPIASLMVGRLQASGLSGKDRAFILSGSCSPDGQQTPFLPFIERMVKPDQLDEVVPLADVVFISTPHTEVLAFYERVGYSAEEVTVMSRWL